MQSKYLAVTLYVHREGEYDLDYVADMLDERVKQVKAGKGYRNVPFILVVSPEVALGIISLTKRDFRNDTTMCIKPVEMAQYHQFVHAANEEMSGT